MKKTYILSLLIIFTINLFSQSTFTYEFSSPYSYTSSKVYSFINDYYLIANRYDSENTNPDLDYNPILIRINKQNNEIDSINWNFSEQNCFFNELIELENGEIALIGAVEQENQPGFYNIFYLSFNNQLDITNVHFYDLTTGTIDYTFGFLNNENNICIATAVMGDPPNFGFQYLDKMILEINIDGEIVFDSIYNQTALDQVYDFIPYPNTSNYILSCSNGFEKTGEINIFDSNYNLISSFYSEDNGSERSLIKTSDSGFISSAISINNGKAYWFASFRKYNESFEQTNYVELGSVDTLSRAALYNSISSIDYHNFYGGYSYNIDKIQFYSSKKSFFSLYSIDKDLNLFWNYYYGGDAYYILNDIATDSDGGCLMVGTKYKNGSGGPFLASLVFYKVDENGQITNTNEPETIPIKNAITTPNPGKDYLQLHTGIYPSLLQIFNINGQLVLEEDINQNTTTINIQLLSSGSYVWQLIKDGEVVETDKWVKE